MKKYILILSLLFSVCSLQSQDTIYPFDENYPFFNDSAFRAISYWTNDYMWNARIVAIEHRNVHAVVSGLAVPYNFGIRTNPVSPDSISVQGVLITIAGNDYDNPQVYYTNSVKWKYNETPHARPYDRHLAFMSYSDCGVMDTVFGAYSLYFNHPIEVGGSVFLGIRMHCYGWSCHSNEGEGLPSPVWNRLFVENDKCDTTVYPNPRFVAYDLYEVDTAGVIQGRPSENGTVLDFAWCSTSDFRDCGARTICPIFDLPDTDSFSCPEVEGLAFAGINAGYPTFVWDTSREHTLYQLAYGPYDAALDSLSIVESTDRFVELTTAPLSRDIYYQARLRARCHHRCPLHDTVIWTSWSDPVYFYTGDSMPDTTHSQPTGISPTATGVSFAIVPNPASEGRMPDVVIEPGAALQGTTLVLRDAAGREVLRRAVSNHRVSLADCSLPAGAYTVTLVSPRGQSTLRMIIE